MYIEVEGVTFSINNFTKRVTKRLFDVDLGVEILNLPQNIVKRFSAGLLELLFPKISSRLNLNKLLS